MGYYVILWLWLMTLVGGIFEDKYCAVRYRRLCQGKGRHVGCQFPDPGPGPACANYVPVRFTNDLKHFILHYINRRRQRIASGNERVRGGEPLPKPQIMMLVEWDRELADLAQRLADQCSFVHDDCRATVKYPYAGQTVGEVRWRRLSDSDELSAKRAIRRVLDAWWGERRRVNAHQLTEPFRLTSKGSVWGHYSQLAVWNLQAVGCGAVRHGAHTARVLLVCDFSHTNMLGQRTIVPGPQAPCPIHTSRKLRMSYGFLCAPMRHSVSADSETIEQEDDHLYHEYDADHRLYTVEVVTKPTQTTSWAMDYDRSKDDQQRWSSDEVLDKEVTDIEEMPRRVYQPDKSLEKIGRDPARTTQRMDHGGEEWQDDAQEFMERPQKPIDNSQRRLLDENSDYDSKVIPISRFLEPSDDSFPLRAQSQHKMSKTWPKGQLLDGPLENYREGPNEDNEEYDSHSHRVWSQSRLTPPRPGANALLTKSSEKPKKPFFMVINLDEEDINQLFQDTGFDLHHRKTM